MESKRSRTIVSTTITTEPSCAEDPSNIDALQDKISDLTQQILLLQSKTDQLVQRVRSQDEHEPEICSGRCRSLVHGPNTVGGGVYLGLVRAGDVVQLGERMQKELDDGLREIAVRLFPRTGGPRRFTEERQAMVALLDKVSLRQDAVPVTSEDYFARYDDPRRGRYQRAAGARYGYMNRMTESRLNAFYYETFLQLVLFRGIDLEELP
ncbi:hypothetical protein DFP73DRAFT_589454 [Morchella snyderi]|nr:hypothetical protein DFP73DRAFT_589454 [Morchella snyderi]